jgi:hypothetical protein
MSISTFPTELYEAVETCSLEPIKALRARLRGDEVIAVKDTVALFDRIIDCMSKDDPEAVERVKAAKQRMAVSKETRLLGQLIDVIEDMIRDTFEARLKEQSPAAYAMSKMLKGEMLNAKKLRVQPTQTYRLPAEVVPAIETRRVELLSLARARLREGNLFKHEEAQQIHQFCIDYTNSRFSPDLIRTRFPSGKIASPNWDESLAISAEVCEEVLLLLETVISDMDYNERHHQGVCVPDGQGRGRSLLRYVS